MEILQHKRAKSAKAALISKKRNDNACTVNVKCIRSAPSVSI